MVNNSLGFHPPQNVFVSDTNAFRHFSSEIRACCLSCSARELTLVRPRDLRTPLGILPAISSPAFHTLGFLLPCYTSVHLMKAPGGHGLVVEWTWLLSCLLAPCRLSMEDVSSVCCLLGMKAAAVSFHVEKVHPFLELRSSSFFSLCIL